LPAILRFAWPFLPGGLCGFILSGGDRLFLLPIAGREQVGLYALGYKLATCVELAAFAPLFNVWSAEVYRAYRHPNASILVGQMFTRLMAPYVWVGLGLCLFQREIVLVLGTAAYRDAVIVIPPLVLAYFFLCTQRLLDSAFYVYRCTHYKLGITILATVTIVILYCLLIPRYGALGAAFSALGAFFVYAVATWIVSQRVFYVRYEMQRLASMLLVAGLLAAPNWWLGSGLLCNAVRLGLLAAWPVAMWTLRLITPEEKRLITGLLVGATRMLRTRLQPSHVIGEESET
jgi:O-antigen/teichoic acid export membrane protein